MNKSLLLFPIILSLTFLVVLGTTSVMAEEGKIPNWFKITLEYYVDGETTDAELIDALQFLIDDGIIQVSEKKYEPFSKEKFPETGGFNPAWLEGERTKILQNCAEASAMGFENAYCKYVQ